MSHSETVVRRAAVALGALQMEEYDDGSQIACYGYGKASAERPGLALRYYSEALSGLRGLLGEAGLRSIDVALTACILLSCIEVCRRDYEAAQVHYTSGLKILKLWKGSRSYATVDCPYAARVQAVIPCYERALIEHFSLLETQVVSFLQSRPGFAQDAVLFEESVSKISIPMEFTTLNEAKETFILIMNTTLNLANRAVNRLTFASTEGEPERDENGIFRHRDTYNASMQFALVIRTVTSECQLALMQWMQAFDVLYRRTCTTMISQEIQSTSILHLGYTVLYTLFARDLSHGEMGYDKYVQTFDDAVSHALVAIRQHHRHSQQQQQQRSRQHMFSLGLGVLTALYFVAIKCRHRTVRESALCALSLAPLQEGLWSQDSTSKMTRVLVEMEETHRAPGTVGPEGIPAKARIIGVNFLLRAENGELVLVVDRPGGREEREVNYGSSSGSEVKEETC